MPRPRLNPDDLAVSSFETAAPGDEALQPAPTLPYTTDPTAATWCFICPPITRDGNCTFDICY